MNNTDIMTPAEQICYSERYSDLGDMSPIDHYLAVGKRQGRFYRCGDFMTWFMANRYRDRYYWIGDEYGRTWKSLEPIRNQWYTNGSLQTNPKLSMRSNYPAEEDPYLCSYEGESCLCEGRIHYGLAMRPDNGSEVDSFQSLLEFGRMTRKASYDDGDIMCNEASMNKNKKHFNFKQFKSLPKQCYCEPLPKYEPYHCSADGGNCSCTGGTVTYGAKFKNETSKKMASFEDVVN